MRVGVAVGVRVGVAVGVAVAVGVGVGVRVDVGVAVGVRVDVGVGVAVGEGVGVGLAVGVGVGVALAVCETVNIALPEAPPKPPTCIQCVTSFLARNCTSEVDPVDPTASSLQVSWTRSELGMVYMARTVSKFEPKVLAVTLTSCVGVKLYQTVLPITTPPQRIGSPTSSEATVVS